MFYLKIAQKKEFLSDGAYRHYEYHMGDR